MKKFTVIFSKSLNGQFFTKLQSRTVDNDIFEGTSSLTYYKWGNKGFNEGEVVEFDPSLYNVQEVEVEVEGKTVTLKRLLGLKQS
jgi:hypothetical protein